MLNHFQIAIPTYLIAKLMRKEAKVILSGDVYSVVNIFLLKIFIFYQTS